MMGYYIIIEKGNYLFLFLLLYYYWEGELLNMAQVINK